MHSTRPGRQLNQDYIQYPKTSVIGDILSFRELAIKMHIRAVRRLLLGEWRRRGTGHFDSKSAILVDKASFSLLKTTDRGIGPPIGQCAVLVIMSSILIETMTQFMAGHSPKAAEIKEAEIIRIFAIQGKRWGL